MQKLMLICQENLRKVLVVEMILFIALFCVILIMPKKTSEITSDDFQLQAGTINDQGEISVDSTSEFGGVFAEGEWDNVKQGAYLVTVSYQSDYDDNGFYVSSDNNSYGAINSDISSADTPVALKSYQSEKTIHVWVKGGKANLTLEFNYCGAGNLTISSVKIEKQAPYWILYVALFLFAAIDMWLFDQKKQEHELDRRVVRVGIVIITILASLPLMNDYLILGTDMIFHLYRIEGIKEGLLSGQFPVKIQPNWWQGYGYGVSFFYADFFLYAPAMLLMTGVSLQNAYKCYIIGINLATAIIAYKSFYGICQRRKTALVGSFLYTVSLYRLLDIYVRGAVGEFTALTFFPLIALGMYRIYTEQKTHSKTHLWSGWFCLTIGLTGCVQSHLLSCEMTAIFILAICFILIKKTLRKQTFFSLCKAFVATILLNLWYIVPFLNLYGANYQFKTDPDSLGNIQARGAFVSQIFSLFINGLVGDQSAINGTSGEMGQSVGLALGLVFLGLISLLYIYRKQLAADGEDRKKYLFSILIVCLAGLAIYLSSNAFPYGFLQGKGEMLNSLIGHIQFPWRFLGFVVLFLSLSFICMVEIIRKTKEQIYLPGIVLGIILLSLVSMGEFYYQILDSDTVIVRAFEFEAVNKTMDQTEYLLDGTEIDTLDHAVATSGNTISIQSYKKNDTTIEVQCTNQIDSEGYIDVPLFLYPCYIAYDTQTGQELSLTYGDNNRIRIIIPASYHGTIVLKVHERKLWRIAELMSILSGIMIVIIEVKQWQFRKKFMKIGRWKRQKRL